MQAECFLCQKLTKDKDIIVAQRFTPSPSFYCKDCYSDLKKVNNPKELVQLMKEKRNTKRND